MNKEDKYVYLDVAIDGTDVGRIVCELFEAEAPRTVNNFYHLCLGDITIEGEDRPLSLKNNYFHRVIKNFMIQAGDVIYGSDKFEKSDNIGKGGCSIYATKENLSDSNVELSCYGNFEDENLGEFTEPFILAMANTGTSGSNSSQFFITTYPSPHLNGKHSIFGKVLHGKYVVRTIENCKVDSDGFPESEIRVVDCGLWNDEMSIPLYNASNDTIGGDIYEEMPDDDRHFDSENFSKASL